MSKTLKTGVNTMSSKITALAFETANKVSCLEVERNSYLAALQCIRASIVTVQAEGGDNSDIVRKVEAVLDMADVT